VHIRWLASMAEIGPAERTAALAELERIEATLTAMSGWLDADGQERAAIVAEDAASSVAGLVFLVERPQPGRMVRRRMRYPQ
jgi:hypothetical protein